MDSIAKIKEDIMLYCGWPKIYQFDESEVGRYDEIKNILKQNLEYHDIVIDENDLADVLSMFVDKSEKFKKVLLRDYLYTKIMEKAGMIVTYDDINLAPYPMKTSELVEALGRITNYHKKSRFRIHIFLDGVTDKMLQTRINDLFTYKTMPIFGYRSKGLMSYVDSEGNQLEALYDYIPESTEKCSKNYQERTRK